MNSTLHSFMDIFDTTFSDGAEAVKLQKITIPIIQRDYIKESMIKEQYTMTSKSCRKWVRGYL